MSAADWKIISNTWTYCKIIIIFTCGVFLSGRKSYKALQVITQQNNNNNLYKLTIIPQVRMGYWLIGYEDERNK